MSDVISADNGTLTQHGGSRYGFDILIAATSRGKPPGVAIKLAVGKTGQSAVPVGEMDHFSCTCCSSNVSLLAHVLCREMAGLTAK